MHASATAPSGGGGLRLAVLTNFLPPYRVALFTRLQQELADLRIFLSTGMEPDRAWTPDWQGLDVHVQRSVQIPRRRRHPAGFDDRGWLHVPYDTLMTLRRFRPDVVISGELGARSVQALAYKKLLARSAKVVLWVTVSQRTEAARGSARLRRALLSRADGVIVNGRSGAAYVQSLGARPEVVTTIPYSHSPDAVFAGEPRRSTTHRRLLYVGQLTRRKGLDRLLSQLAQLPEGSCTLTVVGHGPEREALMAAASTLPLTVDFLGNLAAAELATEYGKADALVFPTLADEWGVVVNEALASGVPVVGSVHSQAVVELVEDGVNGWLFDPEQPETMRAALQRCLTSPPADLDRMKRDARHSASRVWPEPVAAQIADLVTSIGRSPRG